MSTQQVEPLHVYIQYPRNQQVHLVHAKMFITIKPFQPPPYPHNRLLSYMTIMYSRRIRRVKCEMYWFGEKRVFFALALESSPLIWIYLQAGSVWWGIPAQKSWKDFLTCPLRTNAHSTQPTFLLRIFATCLSPSHKSNSHPLQYISHRRQTFHFSFDFDISLLLQASINNSLPPVAYTKAIDVWTGVKILFLWSLKFNFLKKTFDCWLIQGLHLLCLRCSLGVCSCQLRFPFRCTGLIFQLNWRSQVLSFFCRSKVILQRLAKRKQKKQVELDKCAFDPEHMEEPHNGGSFPMVTLHPLISTFLSHDPCLNVTKCNFAA